MLIQAMNQRIDVSVKREHFTFSNMHINDNDSCSSYSMISLVLSLIVILLIAILFMNDKCYS